MYNSAYPGTRMRLGPRKFGKIEMSREDIDMVLAIHPDTVAMVCAPASALRTSDP